MVGLFVFMFGIFGVSNVNAAAPTGFTSQSYSDDNGDGTIDRMWVTINGGEDLTACTVDATELASDWTYVGGATFGGSIASASCVLSSETIEFVITGATAGVTGGGTAPTIAYNNTDGDNSIINASGTLGSVVAASLDDDAIPRIKSIEYMDYDLADDNRMDQLEVTYTEQVAAGSTLRANDLLIDNVGSFTGAVIGTDTTDYIQAPASNSWVLLGTDANAGITNDETGNFAVRTQNAFTLVDAAGNSNAVLGLLDVTIIDGMKPIVVSTTPVDASTAQKRGDAVVVVFSEPMATGSLTFATSPVVAHTPVWSNSNKTLTESHSPYAGTTTYTATLTGLTDVGANALVDLPYAWSYTTARAVSSTGETYSYTAPEEETTTTTVETTTTTTEEETTVAPGCSGGNMYNVQTGAVCVNNATTTIAGCGNRNTGFSTATGVSCAGNKVTTTTTTAKYNFGNTTLKNGSKGEAVKELQRFLNAKLNLGLVVDGSLGPKTIAVIKKWQKDNGLESDGLVGAKTKAMMNK